MGNFIDGMAQNLGQYLERRLYEYSESEEVFNDGLVGSDGVEHILELHFVPTIAGVPVVCVAEVAEVAEVDGVPIGGINGFSVVV